METFLNCKIGAFNDRRIRHINRITDVITVVILKINLNEFCHILEIKNNNCRKILRHLRYM